MDEIYNIFVCWQFLLAAIVVFLIVALFNGMRGWKGIGHYLWGLGGHARLRWVRHVLKFMEAVKVPVMAALGFGLGWLPGMPRPEPLAEASTLSLALLYMVAGGFCIVFVKAVKKWAESRGINLDIDLSPKEQKKNGFKAE